MSDLPEDKLIELAKKAKRIEPEPEGKKKPGVVKFKGKPLFDFMQATGLRAGRNEMTPVEMYEAYLMWTIEGQSLTDFTREARKYFKIEKKQLKVNMKIITLEEKVKELQHEKDKT